MDVPVFIIIFVCGSVVLYGSCVVSVCLSILSLLYCLRPLVISHLMCVALIDSPRYVCTVTGVTYKGLDVQCCVTLLNTSIIVLRQQNIMSLLVRVMRVTSLFV